MKTDNYLEDRIAHNLQLIRNYEQTCSSADKYPVLLSDKAITTALRGMLCSRGKRKGLLKASVSTFREHPLSSLLYRLLQWHGSGGGLWSVFEVQGDCKLVVDYDESKYGEYWTGPKSRLREARQLLPEGITPDQLFDTLDTIAIVLRGGQSAAADNWSRVLGKK